MPLMRIRRPPLVLLALLLAACAGCAPAGKEGAYRRAPTPRAAEPSPLAALHAGVPRIAFLGDSVTFGHGLDSRDEAYPAALQRALARDGVAIEAVNAGVSGDTIARGLARLPEVLALRPDVVVVALGANDAAHDLDAAEARANLRAIVACCQQAGALVLLCGLELPPFIRDDTARAYATLWSEVAAERHVPLVPSLLEGVFGVEGMMQSDVVHPTSAGQERIARSLAQPLRQVLDARRSG